MKAVGGQKIGLVWQAEFLKLLRQENYAEPLKESVRKDDWTKAMTSVVVATCQSLGWQASAKGYPLPNIGIRSSEFLALDVTAFANTFDGDQQWEFPIAVMELENQPDRINYSLWKVLCIRAALRIVFCYCRSPSDRIHTITALRDRVIRPMPISDRIAITGETLVVVGSRDELAIFPSGFFKWWELDTNTGNFEIF